jgi:hypothetical protein
MKALWLLVLLLFATTATAQIPSAANQYKRELTRVVQQEFGLQGNVAAHAAQIHQESAWKTEAKSWVGAEGLAQFMPSTAKWIVEVYPDLGAVAPYSPTWAFRAMARYNKWLNNRVKGHTDCDKWWFTLRSYNGGLGHINAESKNATDANDRHAVDAACGTARRSVKHCPENLGYPDRIINLLEPRYLRAEWAGQPTCPAEPPPPPVIEIPVPDPIFPPTPELEPEPEPQEEVKEEAAPEAVSFWQWLKNLLRDRTREISINS